MLVRLKGPPSGFSTKIALTSTGGGSVTFRNTNGSNYDPAGETITVGTDYEVHLFGVTPSATRDDVVVTAVKSGSVCGEEDLTVIWIAESDIQFRGSDHQGAALTSNSTATFTRIVPGMGEYADDVVGIKLYAPSTSPSFDGVNGQMEMRYRMSPYAVMPDVEWDIQREVARAAWLLELPPSCLPLSGSIDWKYDNEGDLDKDLIQNESLKDIFQIDAPGNEALSNTAVQNGDRYVFKGKLREWAEVRIGNQWFVCSPYKYWHAILYTKFDGASGHWGFDSSKTSEVLPGIGGLTGHPTSWSRD